MPAEQKPLILTLRMDEASQAFFNIQRQKYFPPERNFLNAHIMLFHQLPAEPPTHDFLANFSHPHFAVRVSGVINLGAGVAYRLESEQLRLLHRNLSLQFDDHLIPQDRQGYRPHITIMNKTTPVMAKQLLKELSADFEPFTINATGLELWAYLDGPWRPEKTYPFQT